MYNSAPPRGRSKRLKRATIEKDERSFAVLSKNFSDILSRGEITQNSIIIAYYVLLSIFPIIIIAGNLLPLLNIDTAPISRYLALVFPEQVQSFIMPIVNSLLSNPSGGFISFGILIAIWSFSRLINSIRIAMNRIYGVRSSEKSKTIWITVLNRVVTFASTAVLVFGLFVFVFAVAFGQEILEFLAPIFNFSMEPFYQIMSFRWPAILLVLTFVIAYINYFIPNAKIKKSLIWPGVFVTVIGWALLSVGFSLYVRYFGRTFSNYGIVGTFIIFMLWLNLGSIVMLFGVVVNATIYQWRHGEIDYSSGFVGDLINRQRHHEYDRNNHKVYKKIK